MISLERAVVYINLLTLCDQGRKKHGTVAPVPVVLKEKFPNV